MGEEPEIEFNEAGQRIYRYTQPPSEQEFVHGDGSLIDAVEAHIERHLGGTASVFHEIISTTVHVDIHVVEPSEARPFYTLVTSGMAERPMHPPESASACEFAELCVCLPPDWPGLGPEWNLKPVDDNHPWDDERYYWPVRLLKVLSRFAHEYRSWLWWGHTIPNGDPAEPYAEGTPFTGVMLTVNPLLPQEFHQLRVGDRDISIFTIMPLYTEEIDFKLKHGAELLESLFDHHGVTAVIDNRRPNVALALPEVRKPWWKYW
jgi:hypothetical protein